MGTQIAHGAVRAYVMGERGARNEPATPDDIAAMREIVRRAVAAGALDVSTSRTLAHLAIDGELVPGTFAAEDELFALGELGAGVFELALAGTADKDVVAPAREVDWMRRLSAAVGRPVTFALLQVDAAPDLWRELFDASLRAVDEGADLWPQVAGRATGLLSGHFTTYCLFDQIPAYNELKAQCRTDAELLTALRHPDVRRAVGSWVPPDAAVAAQMDRAYATTYALGDPPDYEPGPERSLTAMAAAAGRPPLAVAYDAMLADKGRGLLYLPIPNYSEGSLEPARQMLLHPRSAAGLADGDAHCGVISDAGQPTFMLTHWTRDHSRGSGCPSSRWCASRRPTPPPSTDWATGGRWCRASWPAATSSTTTRCGSATRTWWPTWPPADVGSTRRPPATSRRSSPVSPPSPLRRTRASGPAGWCGAPAEQCVERRIRPETELAPWATDRTPLIGPTRCVALRRPLEHGTFEPAEPFGHAATLPLAIGTEPVECPDADQGRDREVHFRRRSLQTFMLVGGEPERHDGRPSQVRTIDLHAFRKIAG